MRDLYKVAVECMYELDCIGIKYTDIPKERWEVNTRAKGRFGRTRKVDDGFSIDICSDILDEKYPLEYLKDTIIHELLHTCDGCWNHGKEWKANAKKVNDTYGYNIQRCASQEEQDVLKEINPNLKGKYGVKCKCCGHLWEYNRMCKTVKYPTIYTHTGCGGRLVRAW